MHYFYVIRSVTHKVCYFHILRNLININAKENKNDKLHYVKLKIKLRYFKNRVDKNHVLNIF